jgi:diguanylate cyclase (GGDEF)-like protein
MDGVAVAATSVMTMSAANGAGYSVLVVEDEVGIRRSIAEFFSDSGFIVAEAASGREGLARFRQVQPDLLLTDLCMPNGSGLELIAAVHAESPLTPIIVISGAGMIEDAVTAMKEGACEYLCKPIRDLAALELTVRQTIEQYRRPPESRTAGADPRTGLPDGTRLQALFDDLAASGDDISLVLVDLDNFKAIKDACGHATADRLLQAIGERLALQLGSREALLHLGGDEFALLLTMSDGADLDGRVAALRDAVAAPVTVGRDELVVTVSVGIALFPHDGTACDELLQHAAAALYAAKTTGRNQVRRYCRTIRTNAEQFSLQAKLRRGVERQEFSLVYQPQFVLDNGALHGIEALVRWQPRHGQAVAPARFIPALEESGLIVSVGEWILRAAARQYGEWQAQGASPCLLSVNVSAVQFHARGFVAMVERVLQETGLPPARLCLELTESVVMRDGADAIATMSDLKRLGITLSLDDFGTGYSSLSYLSRMPLDELKIDRSFIAELPHSSRNAGIVDTIIGMAAAMNLRVVAEGIEQATQAAFLRERQCQVAQGYFFCRPLPPQDLLPVFAGALGAGPFLPALPVEAAGVLSRSA